MRSETPIRASAARCRDRTAKAIQGGVMNSVNLRATLDRSPASGLRFSPLLPCFATRSSPSSGGALHGATRGCLRYFDAFRPAVSALEFDSARDWSRRERPEDHAFHPKDFGGCSAWFGPSAHASRRSGRTYVRNARCRLRFCRCEGAVEPSRARCASALTSRGRLGSAPEAVIAATQSSPRRLNREERAPRSTRSRPDPVPLWVARPAGVKFGFGLSLRSWYLGGLMAPWGPVLRARGDQ